MGDLLHHPPFGDGDAVLITADCSAADAAEGPQPGLGQALLFAQGTDVLPDGHSDPSSPSIAGFSVVSANTVGADTVLPYKRYEFLHLPQIRFILPAGWPYGQGWRCRSGTARPGGRTAARRCGANSG